MLQEVLGHARRELDWEATKFVAVAVTQAMFQGATCALFNHHPLVQDPKKGLDPPPEMLPEGF